MHSQISVIKSDRKKLGRDPSSVVFNLPYLSRFGSLLFFDVGFKGFLLSEEELDKGTLIWDQPQFLAHSHALLLVNINFFHSFLWFSSIWRSKGAPLELVLADELSVLSVANSDEKLLFYFFLWTRRNGTRDEIAGTNSPIPSTPSQIQSLSLSLGPIRRKRKMNQNSRNENEWSARRWDESTRPDLEAVAEVLLPVLALSLDFQWSIFSSSPKLTHQYREGNRAYLYALDPHASRLAYFFIDLLVLD